MLEAPEPSLLSLPDALLCTVLNFVGTRKRAQMSVCNKRLNGLLATGSAAWDCMHLEVTQLCGNRMVQWALPRLDACTALRIEFHRHDEDTGAAAEEQVELINMQLDVLLWVARRLKMLCIVNHTLHAISLPYNLAKRPQGLLEMSVVEGNFQRMDVLRHCSTLRRLRCAEIPGRIDEARNLMQLTALEMTQHGDNLSLVTQLTNLANLRVCFEDMGPSDLTALATLAKLTSLVLLLADSDAASFSLTGLQQFSRIAYVEVNNQQGIECLVEHAAMALLVKQKIQLVKLLVGWSEAGEYATVTYKGSITRRLQLALPLLVPLPPSEWYQQLRQYVATRVVFDDSTYFPPSPFRFS